MTDLSPSPEATISCTRCGAQTDGRLLRCRHCGTVLIERGGDASRGDLEVEEVWRAAAADGFDTDMAIGEGVLHCPVCLRDAELASVPVVGMAPARDTPTDRTDLAVWSVRCPHCDVPGRAVAPVAFFDLVADDEQEAAVDAGGRPLDGVASEAEGPDSAQAG